MSFRTNSIILLFLTLSSISVSQLPSVLPSIGATTGSSFNNVLGGIPSGTATQISSDPSISLIKNQPAPTTIKGILASSRRSCQNQDPQNCKLDPPKIARQADSQLVQQLKQIWATYEIQEIEETQKKLKDIEKERLSDLDLSEEQKKQFFAETQEPTESSNNIRKLFSVNNQYQNVDEGNTVAYDEDFLYIIQSNQFKVIRAERTNLTEIYSESFSGTYGREVVVYNKFIAIITQTYSPAKVQVSIYHNTGTAITGVKQFQREGYYVSSRELNGKLSLIVQDTNISDLSWDVNGVGPVFPFVDSCATWSSGTFIRNYATIEMSFSASFEFVTYVGCDYIRTFNFSPSGKWYVVSAVSDLSIINSIIQKVEMNNLISTDWLALSNAEINFPNRLDEDQVSGCNLRVAAVSKIGFDYRLRLYSIDCMFNLESYGVYGPAKTMLTTRWIGLSVYVSFFNSNNGQIYKFTQSYPSFVTSGSVSHAQNIYSLYQYGPLHMIGLGKKSQIPPYADDYSVLLYLISTPSISQVMDYNIDPDTKQMSSPIWESSYQASSIDFINKKIVLPIKSEANEPFSSGFYFLQVETSPACMIYPPINLCAAVGPAPTQTKPLTPRVYKHWDHEVGYNWGTGPSETIRRSVTIKQGTLSYLYTVSDCQVQAREHPSVLNPSLPFTPLTAPSIIDLC